MSQVIYSDEEAACDFVKDRTITSIMSGNAIGYEGAFQIGEGMKNCPNITSLNLAGDDFRDLRVYACFDRICAITTCD